MHCVREVLLAGVAVWMCKTLLIANYQVNGTKIDTKKDSYPSTISKDTYKGDDVTNPNSCDKSRRAISHPRDHFGVASSSHHHNMFKA